MAATKKKQLSIMEGAWTTPSSSSRSKPRLIGNKCPACGEVYFPKKVKNICIHCQHEGLKEIKLSRRGKIITFTVVMQQPGGGYYFGPVPYAIGVIELPEEVYIQAPLKAKNLEDLRVDMEVELVIEKIWKDRSGNELIGFKFQQV